MTGNSGLNLVWDAALLSAAGDPGAADRLLAEDEPPWPDAAPPEFPGPSEWREPSNVSADSALASQGAENRTGLSPGNSAVSADSAEIEQREAKLRALIHDGRQLDAAIYPPLGWVAPGLLPEGAGLLVGPPKLGKSYFALGVLLALASSGTVLGYVRVPPRDVLYLALEDSERRLQRRCRDLLDGQPIPARFHWATRATPREVFEVTRLWMGEHPDGFVVIDTLGRASRDARHGETDYLRDYRFGAELKRITDERPGAGILVVHHARKQGADDWLSLTSGTYGLDGSFDYTVGLRRARGETNATIYVTGRDVEEAEYAATIQDMRWRVNGGDLRAAAERARLAAETRRLGDTSAAVLRALAGLPGGADAQTVTDTVNAAGIQVDKAVVADRLRRLTESGRVVRTKRGHYALPTVTAESAETAENTGQSPRMFSAPATPTAESAETWPSCGVCRQPMPPDLWHAGERTHATCGGEPVSPTTQDPQTRHQPTSGNPPPEHTR